ncbi:MAG: divalent-cation tolerance protein CutA [Oligoflexales bacterium]
MKAEAEFIWIYVTTKDEVQAKGIARALLEQKLVACANITKEMQSLYWWQGKIVEDNESVLILKTTTDKFNAVESAIKKMHSYEEPCIIALPIVAGSKGYLSWLRNQS